MVNNKFSFGGGADFSGITRGLEQTQKTMKEFQARMSDSYKRIGRMFGGISIGKTKEEK